MTTETMDNLICGDNLDVMRGLESASIDLIYLDPPFNKNKRFSASVGSSASGAYFDDRFKKGDVKEEWLSIIKEAQPALYTYLEAVKAISAKKPYNFAYLAYMGVRLLECHRLLKPATGSIYLHCDPTASHYLKTAMDCIFGETNFRNEIIWERIWGGGKRSQHAIRNFHKAADVILLYSAGKDYVFNADAVCRPYPDLLKSFPYHDAKGIYMRRHPFRHPGFGAAPNLVYEYKGVKPPPSGWTVRKERLEELDAEGEIEWIKGKPWRKSRPGAGILPNNIWTDLTGPHPKERTGYPTQKPLALLERIIKASSNAGDIVLDPFCGSGTTCLAAERLERRWIGIDGSQTAIDIVRDRLKAEGGDLFRQMKQWALNPRKE